MKLNAILKLLVVVACASCITACNAQEAESSATEPATQSVTEVATTSVEEPTEDITTVTEEPTEAYVAGDKNNYRDIVSNRWQDLCKTKEYEKATREEKSKMTVEILEELVLEGYVEPDSICADEHSMSVAFRYIDGSKGRFVLKKFDPRLN